MQTGARDIQEGGAAMDRHAGDAHGQVRLGRRIIPGVLAIVLVAALVVGGTFAYFTRTGTASTQLDLASNNTEVEIINSWNEHNAKGTAGEGLHPGDRVNDSITARNVGAGDCYLRVRARITKGSDAATTNGGHIDTARLKALAAPSLADLSAIVGTLYSDPDFEISAGSSLGSGLQATAFTPTFGTSGSANVLNTNASLFTRANLTASNSIYGYVANSQADYGTVRGYVADGTVVAEPTNSSDVRRASAYDTRLGRKNGISAYRNVTTRDEYAHGLLTFEYLGSSSDGRLPLAALVERPLFTTVCVPADYTNAPTGGLDSQGDPFGYTISFWAESVPASDFANSATTPEARRLLAMDRLDSIYPASNYYPSGS